MEIQKQIQISRKKKQLQKNREFKLKKKLNELNRRKIAQENKPQRHKPSNFLKTKKIQKKQFKTIEQKVKKNPIVLQSNVNASTFINASQNYLKILKRTRQIIQVDKKRLEEAVQMLKAVCLKDWKEKDLYIQIFFEGTLNCIIRPIQIQIAHDSNLEAKVYFITQYGKRREEQFEQIKHLNVEIVGLKQFFQRFRQKNEKKIILKSSTKIFCDFKIFLEIQKHKLYKQITKKKVIFPIQNGKVPYSLKNTFSTYASYIQSLNKYTYFMTKSQNQFLINICNIKQLNISQIIQNIQIAYPQIIARILQKNKNKHSRVSKIQLKTNSSIPLQIYTSNIQKQ